MREKTFSGLNVFFLFIGVFGNSYLIKQNLLFHKKKQFKHHYSLKKIIFVPTNVNVNMNIWPVIIISSVLLVIAILLLGVRVFFVKGGKFPNTHIGSSKAMRDRGIGCATSQDREAQKNTKRLSTSDIVEQLKNNN